MNDTEMVVMRILHIVPGVVWVGGAVLMASVIEPSLRALGPAIQGPAMGKLGRTVPPVLTSAAVVTILAGLALVARTSDRDGFSELFSTGWGWSIGLGLLTALVALATGLMSAVTIRALGAIAAEAKGAPSPEQQAQMGRLQARLRLFARTGAVFALVSVALMSAARFV